MDGLSPRCARGSAPVTYTAPPPPRCRRVTMRSGARWLREHFWHTLALAMVLPGVLTAGVQFTLTGGVDGPIPIVSAIVGGVLATLMLRPPAKNESPPSSVMTHIKDPQPTPTTSVQTPKREWSLETVEELMKPRASKRVADRLTRSAAEGRWILFEGKLHDVEERFDGIHLGLSLDLGKIVFARVNPDWRDYVQLLEIGARVVVIGRIETIEEYYVSLSECELIPTGATFH